MSVVHDAHAAAEFLGHHPQMPYQRAADLIGQLGQHRCDGVDGQKPDAAAFRHLHRFQIGDQCPHKLHVQ